MKDFSKHGIISPIKVRTFELLGGGYLNFILYGIKILGYVLSIAVLLALIAIPILIVVLLIKLIKKMNKKH